MTPDERTLLTGFFDRLGQAPATAKDQEADGLIRAAIDRDPDLAYRMAQTALVYEHGLAAAQEQIRKLQSRPPAVAGGSFLGSVPRVPMAAAGQGMPGQVAPGGAMFAGRGFGGGGQGFLGSAMSTALGVAGGMALFSGLESMFGGGMAAQAAVPQDGIAGQAPMEQGVADQGMADQAAAPAGPWGAPAAEPAAHDGAGYDPASTTYDQGVYDPSVEDPGGFGDGGDFDFDF
ncbi:MAG: DUF2076 family protein [Sneathiellaceae bacterium]